MLVCVWGYKLFMRKHLAERYTFVEFILVDYALHDAKYTQFMRDAHYMVKASLRLDMSYI